jgi:hypothetical protein
MKKILIFVFIVVLFAGCVGSVGDRIRYSADFIFYTDTTSLMGSMLYFDSYERVDNKLTFFDKNGKYVGEAFETERSAIARNMKKVGN